MSNARDLIKQKFGDLTVIKQTGFDKYSHRLWECRCVCGTVVLDVLGYNLTTGNTESCGCGKIRNSDKHGNWRGYGEIQGKYWNGLKRGATSGKRSRIIPFEITIEYAWDLFLKQNRKCALSGVPLVFAKTNALRERGGSTASLDRKDSSRGYVEGNVQWVHKDVNYMKQDLDESYFIEMCRKISNLNKRKRYAE